MPWTTARTITGGLAVTFVVLAVTALALALVLVSKWAMLILRELWRRRHADTATQIPATNPPSIASLEQVAAGVKETLLADPMLRDLTRRFCDSTIATVELLRMRLHAGEHDKLATAAHQLAGAGGSYGFHEITREAQALEQLAKSSTSADALQQQIERVAAACAAARTWMTAATAPTH